MLLQKAPEIQNEKCSQRTREALPFWQMKKSGGWRCHSRQALYLWSPVSQRSVLKKWLLEIWLLVHGLCAPFSSLFQCGTQLNVGTSGSFSDIIFLSTQK